MRDLSFMNNGRHFNKLAPAEAERLALLLEEMGEAQQVIGKILRHGYASFNPNDPGQGTNRTMLERELGDVLAAIDLMTPFADLNSDNIQRARRDKHDHVHRYLHHQEPRK